MGGQLREVLLYSRNIAFIQCEITQLIYLHLFTAMLHKDFFSLPTINYSSDYRRFACAFGSGQKHLDESSIGSSRKPRMTNKNNWFNPRSFANEGPDDITILEYIMECFSHHTDQNPPGNHHAIHL